MCEKIRVRDLQARDLFEMYGILYIVTKKSETEVFYYKWNLEWNETISGRMTMGTKSMKFVYWIAQESKAAENKAELKKRYSAYSNRLYGKLNKVKKEAA